MSKIGGTVQERESTINAYLQPGWWCVCGGGGTGRTVCEIGKWNSVQKNIHKYAIGENMNTNEYEPEKVFFNKLMEEK